MREWYVLPGRKPDFCPFCGDDLVHEDRTAHHRFRGRPYELRNPDHRLWNADRIVRGGTLYAFDRYVCER